MAKNKGKSKNGEMPVEEFDKELIRLAKQLHDHCKSNRLCDDGGGNTG